MFRLENEDTLLAAFRPKDRKVVQLAPEVKFPTIVRHYLSWVHPEGGRVFLVFHVPGGAPTGIVFDTSGGANPEVPQMCDSCHTSAPAPAWACSPRASTRRRTWAYTSAPT